MELKNGTALKGGEYVIKRKLGQGGMGITYLATIRNNQTNTAQPDVVVKEFFISDYCDRSPDGHTVTVLSQKFNDAVEAGLKKFRKEAFNLSQMEHENIVHVIDLFGENDTEYIVMDFLPGGSLQDYVNKHGPLPADEAVKRISEVAGALQYMHDKKLCHFDVKPGNVMLGAEGQAVLIDFGIAKHYGADDRHTSSILFMGVSEGYAPLEQSSDSVETFSPQTDVYALGATLYFLLMGKRPGKASFNINNVLPKERPDAIPEHLWLLIHRCMQPIPGDRPGDASEFLRMLKGEIPVIAPQQGKATAVFHRRKKEEERPLPSQQPVVRVEDGKTAPSTWKDEDLRPSFEEPEERTGSGGKILKYGLVAAVLAMVFSLGYWLMNRPEQETTAEAETTTTADEDEALSEDGFENTPGPQTFTVEGVSFTMIPVEGGTFTMGATPEQGDDAYDLERPAHQVTLSSYRIGKTEVTQELWKAVMGSNPSEYKGNKRPVENVSWDDCQAFIKKLNDKTSKTFRLPTEAEWEFAARGGNLSQGYKYAGSNTLNEVAWYWDNIPSQAEGQPGYGTQPVATKAPNELGLYDMAGNVSELCNDWYGDYSSSAQTDPTGPSSGSDRVLRGGVWFLDAEFCRVSFRSYCTPSGRNLNCGLRLAL